MDMNLFLNVLFMVQQKKNTIHIIQYLVEEIQLVQN